MYRSSILITTNGGLVWLPNHFEINVCNFFFLALQVSTVDRAHGRGHPTMLEVNERTLATAYHEQGCHLRNLGG